MSEWKESLLSGCGSNDDYEIVINGLRISVVRHLYYPNTWCLICRKIGITEPIDMRTNDLEEAKERAINEVMAILAKSIDERYQWLEGCHEYKESEDEKQCDTK